MFLIHALLKVQKKTAANGIVTKLLSAYCLCNLFFHIIPSSEDLPNYKVFKVGTLLFVYQEVLFLVVTGLDLLSN